MEQPLQDRHQGHRERHHYPQGPEDSSQQSHRTQGAEATFTGQVNGFVEGEGLTNASDLAFTADTNAEPGKHAIIGTLKGKTKGNYGKNYTFTNAKSNKTALTIKARKVKVVKEQNS